jgi:thioredoxin-related protein
MKVSGNMTVRKIFLTGLVLMALIFDSHGQVAKTAETIIEDDGPVKWMTFEAAVEKSKTEKRKIFIDLYTDWCGWCKVMDKNTFSEELIANILNEKFYPVKFNAEQRADVVFQGYTFKFIVSGNSGVHQLAASLLSNKLAYPSQVFLDEEFHIIQPIQGYQKPDEFHKIIKFIGEDGYKKAAWSEWLKGYKSPYASTLGEANPTIAPH